MTKNTPATKHVFALNKACKIMGSQAALAKALEITSANISQWRKSISGVPAHHCPQIEKLTGIKAELLNSSVNWKLIRDRKNDK